MAGSPFLIFRFLRIPPSSFSDRIRHILSDFGLDWPNPTGMKKLKKDKAREGARKLKKSDKAQKA